MSKEAKLFKNKLINEYKQIQYNVITKSNKLQILSHTKQIIKYEKYLNELSVDHRRAITKINKIIAPYVSEVLKLNNVLNDI